MASQSVFKELHAKEKQRADIDSVDWISKLPDEILFKILSLLTLHEAATTSVLSSRWIHLWKWAVTVLDFDGSKLLELPREQFVIPMEPVDIDDWIVLDVDPPDRFSPPRKKAIVVEKRLMYINWVNSVLRQHNASKISKFRISSNLEIRCNSEGDIDRWLEFAISKRVEYLELSLGVNEDHDFSHWQDYRFSQDCFNHIKSPIGLSDIKYLRSLRLSYVNVTGEVIEHLIANCPLLEELALHRASRLGNLRIAGSSSSPLPLKNLEVSSYSDLYSLEIDHAPSLARFSFCGEWMDVSVDNCTSLVDVVLYFADRFNLPSFAFDCLSAYLGQLESLSMEIHPHDMNFRDMTELTCLEKLKIQVFGGRFNGSMLRLVHLINACPRLHTLRVECGLVGMGDQGNFQDMKPVEKECRESIKVVEMIDFNGYEIECEFIKYVLKYFIGLEKIVIDGGFNRELLTLL
ncbi:F-box/FBD/LRR-repeat protein At1g13570 [Linum perenne]